jgi:hypothetical protein
MTGFFIFGRGKDFSLLHHGIQTGFEVRTAFYSKDTEDAFRDIRELEREADPHTYIQYLGLIRAGSPPSFHWGGLETLTERDKLAFAFEITPVSSYWW